MWRLLELFSMEMWRFILAPVNRHEKWGLWWLRIPLCRYRGHPAGVVWFNPGGYRPDMHCKNCGDDLG